MYSEMSRKPNSHRRKCKEKSKRKSKKEDRKRKFRKEDRKRELKKEDRKREFKTEDTKKKSGTKRKNDGREFDFNRFPRYNEICAFLRKIENKCPDQVEIVTIGKTLQGRNIEMIIIKNKAKTNKNGVLIDAGIHAREWLTHTTVLYLIDHLVKDNTLLNLMDFYIIPCLNPDGYEFSHTCNRLWRKNMNPNGVLCPNKWGVDLNRNFPIKFGQKGSSRVPSSNMYRGKNALSEAESKSLANVMYNYKGILKLYISVHTYGNFIMYPWSHTKQSIEDREILDDCGNKAKIAMFRCNKRWFRVGTAASQMYLVAGSSTDYAKGCHNIKFSYCLELQKFGKSGFQPKRKHILPIGEETLRAIKTMVEYVDNFYKVNEPVKKIKTEKIHFKCPPP